MSLAPRCLECDALYGRAHDPECSEAQPEPPPPLGPDRGPFSVPLANYMAQARAAEEGINRILAAARAAGHTVIGDTIIVSDSNKGTV